MNSKILLAFVVATQDWHPQSHKSFASNHPGKKAFESIMLHGLEQVLWPDHCIQGSIGAQIHPSIIANKVEGIFRKGMDPEIDSYSGFYDNGYKKSTGLAGYLRERKIKKVYVCGLAADYCVYYTAKDSLKENFETYFIEDATRAIDPNGFVKAKENILFFGGQIIKSRSALQALVTFDKINISNLIFNELRKCIPDTSDFPL
jgi:nicotinamidase/pyrazinamidase